MPFEFRLPDLGEGVEEVELLEWNVQAGQAVAAFQPLCQVESAKAAVELTSPVAGRVSQLCAEPGGIVKRGELLVTIDTDVANGGAYFGIVGAPPKAAQPPATQAPEPRR